GAHRAEVAGGPSRRPVARKAIGRGRPSRRARAPTENRGATGRRKRKTAERTGARRIGGRRAEVGGGPSHRPVAPKAIGRGKPSRRVRAPTESRGATGR